MARVGFSGDFDALKGWEKLFQNADKLPGVISRHMAEETLGLISEGFRTETDPYGKRWAPKKTPDGRKVLSGKTSRLKKFAIGQEDKYGFRVFATVDYALPHQAPDPVKALRPRRMMVPDGSRGLPKAWAQAYEDTATEVFSAYFTGGGGMGFVAAKLAAARRQLNIKMIIRRAISRA